MSVLTGTRPAAVDKAAEREARLDALRERLDEAVAALVTGEDWKRAVTFAARFRRRSFNNTLLIWVQHLAAYEAGETDAPTPTFVAGFKQWRAMGRHVRKGRHGYQIFAPVTAQFASATPADPSSWYRLGRGEHPGPGEQVRSQMVGSRVTYVWDVSATEGAPLPVQPEPPRLLQGQAPAGLWAGVATQITARGYHLQDAANARELHGANGITDHTTRTVRVRADMDDAARCKTALHELAHCLQSGLGVDPAGHRGIAEVEAESVALMVAAAHGLDTSDYSVPYVSSWATTVPGNTPLEVVRSTAERVRAMAVQILDALDTTQTSTGGPTG